MSQVTVTEIIAIVFDFDDTLMPDSTSKLLRAHGIKPEDFWPKSDELIRLGYDQPTAYLKLLLDNVGKGRPLGKLTNEDLEKFGAGLDEDFFPGLPNFLRMFARRSDSGSRTSTSSSTSSRAAFRQFWRVVGLSRSTSAPRMVANSGRNRRAALFLTSSAVSPLLRRRDTYSRSTRGSRSEIPLRIRS